MPCNEIVGQIAIEKLDQNAPMISTPEEIRNLKDPIWANLVLESQIVDGASRCPVFLGKCRDLDLVIKFIGKNEFTVFSDLHETEMITLLK